MTTVLAWVLVFGVLVAVHEFGHYAVAKAVGIRVDEYALGFGPAIWARRWGETLYALRAIPLGGYCRLAGMDGDDRGDPRSFPRKPLWQRLLVVLAGPLMNLLLAGACYVVVFGPIGVPVPTTTVGITMPGYPAQTAGVRPGDRIVAVDGQRVDSWSALEAAIRRHARAPLRLTLVHGGVRRTVVVPTRYDAAVRQRIIGIQPRYVSAHLPIFAAIGAGVAQTAQLTALWFAQLFRLLTGQGPFDVAGPVGMAVMVGQAVQQGVVSLILLAAALSANLGLFNLLPVPVLDGSRLLFLGVEGIRRRPIDPEKENLIHMVGLMVLLGFIVFVTYHDLLRLVRQGVSG
ncbi:MAG: M50 family metallopeptidase [Actinomycetia bacterium]|nr:M50 family metallopeptidase [Actinomycetes bacterium]